MNTELSLIENINAIEVFTNRETLDNLLEKISINITSYVTDPTTEKGRKEIISFAYQVSQIKNELDRMGKEVVADWKEKTKKIDMERSRAWMFLEKLQKDIREPVTLYENREKVRVNTHEQNLSKIFILIQGVDYLTIEDIDGRFKHLDEIYNRDWEEFSDRATKAYEKAYLILNETKLQKILQIEEQKIIAEEREKERKIHEEQIRQEAIKKAEAQKAVLEKRNRLLEEQITKAKEQATKAKEKLSQEIIYQQQKINEALEWKEQEKRAKEAFELKEQEKREANKKHRNKIHNEINESLWDLGVQNGQEIIEAIESGHIPHLKIEY